VKVLVLGAGYIGAKLGELALSAGHDVTLADNWFATEQAQLDGLAEIPTTRRRRTSPAPDGSPRPPASQACPSWSSARRCTSTAAG
jgi:nucleoside-diphosphate-sugar epimerase